MKKPDLKPAIAYYRVSRKSQEASHLGLDAQKTSVEAFVKANGYRIFKEYEEVESGTKCDRPALQTALAHAKRDKVSLIIARLDRLARNMVFTATLLASEVDFVVVDMPSATRLTLHIYAALAEEEARVIGMRTKAALAELKKRGVKLGASREGFWNDVRRVVMKEHLEKARVIAGQKKRQLAVERWQGAFELVLRMQDDSTLKEIGEALTKAGFNPAHSTTWHSSSVKNLILLAKQTTEQKRNIQKKHLGVEDEIF